jgi:hypothetical protein
MIDVLSKKSRLKTKSLDLVIPFELDQSTKINVTKLSVQLLNFRGRIFAQKVAAHFFGNTFPLIFQRRRRRRLALAVICNFRINRKLRRDTVLLSFSNFQVWLLKGDAEFKTLPEFRVQASSRQGLDTNLLFEF